MNTTGISQDQNEVEAADDLSGELLEPRWSVISFEKCEASGLAYAEASSLISELNDRRIPGLCIVTDEAAAKIKR